MENWQRTIAATQPERPTKVRRNSNATGSKDDLERQCLLISTRFRLRNARDVSLLNSICYFTVKLPKDHSVCAPESARRPTGRTQLKNFSTHPPKDKKLAAADRCCRVQEAWKGTHVKFYFRLSPAYITFETNIMTALEQSGGDRLYGQAPCGSLERKALDLLKKWEVQIDKPIGSCLCSTCTVDGGDSPLSLSLCQPS